jgi:hypothetical protein
MGDVLWGQDAVIDWQNQTLILKIDSNKPNIGTLFRESVHRKTHKRRSAVV